MTEYDKVQKTEIFDLNFLSQVKFHFAYWGLPQSRFVQRMKEIRSKLHNVGCDQRIDL